MHTKMKRVRLGMRDDFSGLVLLLIRSDVVYLID